MHKYTIKSATGGETLFIDRVGKDMLQLDIGDKKVKVFTEDLAALVREELPKDRANEMFSEIDEKAISRGKARIVVAANKDLKKGEKVCFTVDISKYLDSKGNPTGVRTTSFGLIY